MNIPVHGHLITSAGRTIKVRQIMDNVYTRSKDIALIEILDRVLDKGVVISGDIVISVADVDLIYVGLKVLLSSVETMNRLKWAEVPCPESPGNL